MQDLGYPGQRPSLPHPEPTAAEPIPDRKPTWGVRSYAKTSGPRFPSDEPPPAADRARRFLAIAVHRGNQVLLWLCAIVGLLLVTRLLLAALNASPTAPFVQFVFDRTSGVVEPFTSMFKDQDLSGHPIEVNTVIALVVYSVALLVFVKLIEAFLTPRKPR